MKTKMLFALVIKTIIFLGVMPPNVWALSLDPSHFLYPMDYEYLLLEDIEALPFKSQAQKLIQQCLDSEQDHGVSHVVLSYRRDEKVSATLPYEQAKKEFVCRTLQAQASDWSKVKSQRFWNKDTQVLYFGERHLDIPVQKEFARTLDVLASEGFRTLAMEMFPFSVQKELDDFLNDKISLEDILLVLKAHWSYNEEGYAEILKSAKKNKIKIIGIDQRQNMQSSDLLKNITARDDIMAYQISLHLEQHAHDKVIVYAGALHTPLHFSEQGLIKSQVQKLQDLYFTKHNRDLNIESFVMKWAQKNRLFDILEMGYDLPKGTDILVSHFKSLDYVSGIILIHGEN